MQWPTVQWGKYKLLKMLWSKYRYGIDGMKISLLSAPYSIAWIGSTHRDVPLNVLHRVDVLNQQQLFV